MKWILIIVVLIVVAGALYLRTVRTSGDTRRTVRPHRLDDSVSPHHASRSDDTHGRPPVTPPTDEPPTPAGTSTT